MIGTRKCPFVHAFRYQDVIYIFPRLPTNAVRRWSGRKIIVFVRRCTVLLAYCSLHGCRSKVVEGFSMDQLALAEVALGHPDMETVEAGLYSLCLVGLAGTLEARCCIDPSATFHSRGVSLRVPRPIVTFACSTDHGRIFRLRAT